MWIYLCLYNLYLSSYCSSGRRTETTPQANHRTGGTECHLEQAHREHEARHREAWSGGRATAQHKHGTTGSPRQPAHNPHWKLQHSATTWWERAVGSLNTKFFSKIFCKYHLCLCLNTAVTYNGCDKFNTM